MERLNFQAIEKKWQSTFEKEKLYNSKKFKKVLLFRNVSISIWKNSYGTCKKLHNW